MNRSRVLLSFSLLALLIGCASLQPEGASYDRTDHQYMGKIERAARAANVQVVWINPPRLKQNAQ
jgi:hypothetical protein